MNLKNIIRILKRPSCWVSVYKSDERLDAFYKGLIRRKDEVQVVSFPDALHGESGEAVLKLNGVRYAIWVCRWNSTLSSVTWHVVGKRAGFSDGYVNDLMPSRSTAFDFVDTFAPSADEDSYQTKALRNLLKSIITVEVHHDNT